MARKKKENISIAPTGEDNQQFKEALSSIPETQTAAPKRHRRTKAEIESERNALSDNGFEIWRDFLVMLNDNDVRKFGLPKDAPEVYEPLARQYAMILNYFLPQGKPIYIVCVTAAWQTFSLIKTRKELIDKSMPKKEKKPENIYQPVIKSKIFPSSDEVKKQKV